MQAYEYAFEIVPMTIGVDGLPALPAHRAVIAERARDGWRLVQVFVPNPAAVPSAYELIFERRPPLVTAAASS
jgi:hypothetical protein